MNVFSHGRCAGEETRSRVPRPFDSNRDQGTSVAGKKRRGPGAPLSLESSMGAQPPLLLGRPNSIARRPRVLTAEMRVHLRVNGAPSLADGREAAPYRWNSSTRSRAWLYSRFLIFNQRVGSSSP
jgi:hypothetical protein